MNIRPAVLLLLSVPAFAVEPVVTLDRADIQARVLVAKSKAAALAVASRPVVSVAAKSGNALQAALGSCSDDVRRGFLSSLVFVGGKFAGAKVDGVQGCLGAKGYDSLRAQFGPITVADNKGYRCESKGTCAESQHRICTSNCMTSGADFVGVSYGGKRDMSYFSLEKELSGISEGERNKILDSLSLENGRIGLAR